MKKVLVVLTVVAVMVAGCGKAKKAVTPAPEKKATVTTAAAVETKTTTAAAVATTPSAL